MGTIWQDVRYALRMLRKSPGFAAIALVTLAIGIGANTIMFSVSDFLLFLRAKKVKAPEQLAYCAIQGVDDSRFRYSEYLTVRDSGLAFHEVMAQFLFPSPETLALKGKARKVWATYVSANYFSVLGVAPVQGRSFQPEEEQSGSAPVVVLAHTCWRRLGGDPKLVGEFVSVNGTDCHVVGVAPEGFTGVTHDGPDLWLSLGSLPTVSKAWAKVEPWFHIVGRLKPGLDRSVAQAQLQTLFPGFKPECIEDRLLPNPSFNLRPPGRWEISGDNEQDHRLHVVLSLILITVSLLILGIACLNLANMLIVQGAARGSEITVRMALGGGRGRIVRQLLVESALLAVLGGFLGTLLAFRGLRVLNTWIATLPNTSGDSLQVGLNVRVLMATLGLCLTTILLFGLRPALLLSKRDIADAMKGGTGRVLGALRQRRAGLSVAGQIALAVALVLSAVLLTRSALRMARPDPRFPLDDKLVVEIDPQAGGYDRVRGIQACEALADHLASLPEVKAVGTSGGVFFGGGGRCSIGRYVPGGEEGSSGRPLAREAALVGVGRDYFQAMQIPLLQGRFFDQHDRLPNAEKVAVIDESLARKLRSDGNALDCLIQWGISTKLVSDPYRVVGIVAHLPGIEFREVCGQMYTPTGSKDLAPFLYLHVESARSADFLQGLVSERVHQFDSRLPILSVATLAEKRKGNSSVWPAEFGARLGLSAGAAALFLAALGIYAIKGYMVAARTSEIGIRKALGATHGDVIGMVLREGLVMTMVGLTVGLLLGLGIAKVAGRFLYGIGPLDPISIVVTVALLGATALLAGYLPARRAAKVDPMVALRYE